MCLDSALPLRESPELRVGSAKVTGGVTRGHLQRLQGPLCYRKSGAVVTGVGVALNSLSLSSFLSKTGHNSDLGMIGFFFFFFLFI